MLIRNIVLEIVIIKSCSGVTIKEVKNIPPTPLYFIIVDAFFEGIFFEKFIKNFAKLRARKIIPMSAQILEGLSKPFSDFVAKRLLIKLRVQSKPIEFLSYIVPPG